MDVKLLVLAALFQFGVGAPVAAFPLSYVPGKTYTYTYTTETRLSEPGPAPRASQVYGPVGFKLSASVDVNPVWQKGDQMLLKLALNTPQLHSVATDQVSRELQGLPRKPVYFHWDETHVRRVYCAEDDNTLTSNIKKGVISLLQLRLQTSEEIQPDASGECRTKYTREGATVTKVKTGCVSSDRVGEYFNVNPILGTTEERESVTSYVLEDDVIKTARAQETFTSRLSLHQNLATAVTSSQELQFQSSGRGQQVKADSIEAAMKNIEKGDRQSYLGSSLESRYEVRSCTKQCQTFSEKVSKLRGDLSAVKVGSTEAGNGFLTLVQACRQSSKSELSETLSHNDNQNIRAQLLDVLTACQTDTAQEVALSVLNFDDDYYIDQPERYLLGIAMSTHPTPRILTNLLELYKKRVPSEKLRESVMGALGGVVRAYCGVEDQCQSQLVHDIQRALVEGLQACDVTADPVCQPMHIRALSNAGLPDTIPTLLELAEQSDSPAVNEAAIKAVRSMDRQHLARKEVRDVMVRIFHQERRGYDTAVRSQALSVILETRPSLAEVRRLLDESSDPWNTEYDSFIQSRLFNVMEYDADIRSHVINVLSHMNVSNYHILAPKGKSLAFTSPMAETDSVKADYFMYVENSRAGVLKRSGMDVLAYDDANQLSIYSFGMFAAGMEGLLGEEVEPGQENIDPTAGLALDLLGVSLRPITFFTGQSGLMSAVWNAPSEPTSALQVNVLLQDHAQRVHLGNGLIVEHNVQGALSLDLSGSLSVSLWNKNAKSLIQTSGAIVMQGSTSLVTPSFKAEVAFTADTASVISFRSDVDFYDGVKTCLQMGRPAFQFRHTVSKYESARHFKTGLRMKIRRIRNIPNISYPLPKRNYEQCRSLQPDS